MDVISNNANNSNGKRMVDHDSTTIDVTQHSMNLIPLSTIKGAKPLPTTSQPQCKEKTAKQ